METERWRMRLSDAEIELKQLGEPLGARMTSALRSLSLLEAGVTLVCIGRHAEAMPLLRLAEHSALVVLGERPIPDEWSQSGTDTVHPCGERAPKLERAWVAGQLHPVGWLLHGTWDQPWAHTAATLMQDHCRGQLWAASPALLLHYWLAAGRADLAVEAYERTYKPARRLVLPPANNRFASGQVNALYVVAAYLAGEARLAASAQSACELWIQRIRRWRVVENLHEEERLYWAHLWSAHFGGPQDPHEVIRALRGF